MSRSTQRFVLGTRLWILIFVLWILAVLLLYLFPLTPLFWYLLALGAGMIVVCFARMERMSSQRIPRETSHPQSLHVYRRILIIWFFLAVFFFSIAFFGLESLIMSPLYTLPSPSMMIFESVSKGMIGFIVIHTTVHSLKMLSVRFRLKEGEKEQSVMDDSLGVSRSKNDSWAWIEAEMVREGEKDLKHVGHAAVPILRHPERNVSRLSLILPVCCLVGTMVAGIFFSQSSLDPTLTFKFPPWMLFGETGLCFAFLVAMGYRRVHALQVLERRRGACTRETSARTAANEVASQGEISPLLCAITAFPQRAAVWRRVVYLSLGALVLCLVPFIGMLVGGDLPLFYTIMSILAVFFSFLCARIAFFFFKAEISIEARECGLQVKKGGDGVLTEQIAWDEACLFACYTLPNFLPGEKIQYYELSSSTQVIIWIGVSGTVMSLPLWRSAPSAQEDHRQMQALCDVITAKTGLALCNLTGPRVD